MLAKGSGLGYDGTSSSGVIIHCSYYGEIMEAVTDNVGGCHRLIVLYMPHGLVSRGILLMARVFRIDRKHPDGYWVEKK
jgi:hypothetical protein